MVPTVGRIVLVLVDPWTNNGSDIAPAVITRVWSHSDDRADMVNLRLLCDNNPSPSEWKTSASLYEHEGHARAAVAELQAANPKAKPNGMHAFWPPRI